MPKLPKKVIENLAKRYFINMIDSYKSEDIQDSGEYIPCCRSGTAHLLLQMDRAVFTWRCRRKLYISQDRQHRSNQLYGGIAGLKVAFFLRTIIIGRDCAPGGIHIPVIICRAVLIVLDHPAPCCKCSHAHSGHHQQGKGGNCEPSRKLYPFFMSFTSTF